MASGWPVPEAGRVCTHSWKLPWRWERRWGENIQSLGQKKKPLENCMWGFRILCSAPTGVGESNESGPVMPLNIPGTYIRLYSTYIYIWIFVNICIYIPQQHIQISVESSKFSNLIPRGCISLIYFQLREKRHMDTHTQSNQSQMTAIYIYVRSFEVFHYGNIAKCM